MLSSRSKSLSLPTRRPSCRVYGASARNSACYRTAQTRAQVTATSKLVYADKNVTLKYIQVIHTHPKGTVHPKMNICLKCTPLRPSKMQLRLFLHQKCNLYHLLINGCSAVNGCRQNENPNSWYKHHQQVINTPPVHQLMTWEAKRCMFKSIIWVF